VRHAILPVSAMILCRNKFVVKELCPGDQVQGFDYQRRRLAMGTICAIIPVDPVQKVLVPVSHYKIVPIAKETVGLTSTGVEGTIVSAKQFLGFCHEKLKLIVRELGCPREYEDTVEAVELQWEWPDYIWFEGILVGTVL